MNAAKILKMAATAAVTASCALALAACSGGSSASTGDAAATVNGTPIAESEITAQIESVHSQFGEGEKWAQYFTITGSTPEDLRKEVIDSYVEQVLLEQNASSLGVEVTDAELDEYVKKARDMFAATDADGNVDEAKTDEAWKNALAEAGFTEQDYRDTIKKQLLSQKVSDHFKEAAEIDDDALLDAAKEDIATYDGAKRSSHVLFNTDDKETAESVLLQIKSGDITLAEAAAQYSQDEGSKEKDGDVGWDKLTSFVEAYQTALDGLEVGEISDLVESDYGYHIIECTDEYNAPEKLKSMDKVPTEIADKIREDAKSEKATTDMQEWIDGLRESADIQVNDMPADLPYYIDLSQYQTEDESAEGSDASADAEEGEDAEILTDDETASNDEAAASEEATSEDAAATDEAAASEESAPAEE